MPIHRHRSAARRIRGQSIVEFAVILPILLTMFGASIDIARVYSVWVTLEGATRDAAEQVASDPTIASSGAASTKAQAIVCSQMAGVAGFVAPPGNPTSCTTPAVTVAWSTPNPSTSVGGTTRNPIGNATVTATFPFRTLFPYPLFTQNGAWVVGSTQTYSISQGR